MEKSMKEKEKAGAKNRQAGIMILSEDEALRRLIAYEAEDLSLPLTAGTAFPEAGETDGTVIVDLALRGATRWLLSDAGRAYRVIGVGWSADEVPAEIHERLDAFLTRPFAMKDLRRALSDDASGSASDKKTSTVPNTAKIKLDGLTLTLNDRAIKLTQKEAALFACLLENRGKVVRRETLDACIGTTRESETGTSNKTEVYLCFLRRKLEVPTGKRLITTVRGIGYRLN